MNKAEGIKLWEKAAAQSGEVQTIAQYNLRIAYSSGGGVSVGNFEISKWLKSSAEQGHALSQSLLGAMHYESKVVLIDKIEACKW